jgi:hypothetical protein
MPRRFVAVAVAVLGVGALTGCSPAQTRAWLRWWREEPRAAVEWASNDCDALCTDDWDHDGVVEPEPVIVEPEAATSETASDYDEPDQPADEDDADGANEQGTGACAEWYGTAISAGWSPSDWPTVDRIMYAESRCNPGAYNGASGVTGLMQIMPFWAEDCGGSPGDLYDPWFNLSCALHVRAVQGWGAWVTY